MARTPRGRNKTDIRTRYKKQMDRLKQCAGQASQALINSGRPDWMIPDRNGWSGDLFQIEEMKKAFERTEHYKDFVDTISDAENPGTTGDLAATQLQGDFLASMERAFRERHKTGVRCMIQSSARQKGQSERVFEQMLTGYIQRILTKGAGGSQ